MICNILSYVEKAVADYPDNIAVSDANNSMTYSEVWRYVSSFGAMLAEKLHTANRAVAVCLRHDIYDILAFFSVVYSGNFYVPVDLSLPAERVKHMLTVSEPI